MVGKDGNNTLSLKGIGLSDGYGVSIDNVSLFTSEKTINETDNKSVRPESVSASENKTSEQVNLNLKE